MSGQIKANISRMLTTYLRSSKLETRTGSAKNLKVASDCSFPKEAAFRNEGHETI